MSCSSAVHVLRLVRLCPPHDFSHAPPPPVSFSRLRITNTTFRATDYTNIVERGVTRPFHHFTMRKLVLGILALISVQFAFVTYTMVLQSPTELTGATPPTQVVPRKVRFAPIDHFTGSSELKPLPEVAVPRMQTAHPHLRRVGEHITPERTARLERSSVSIEPRPAFARTPSTAAASTEFENVVISYNRNPKLPDCATPSPSKTKKRSYLAKASPVIKKPWEWIKTVASKLN